MLQQKVPGFHLPLGCEFVQILGTVFYGTHLEPTYDLTIPPRGIEGQAVEGRHPAFDLCLFHPRL